MRSKSLSPGIKLCVQEEQELDASECFQVNTSYRNPGRRCRSCFHVLEMYPQVVMCGEARKSLYVSILTWTAAFNWLSVLQHG
mmetsp:Transcript_11294/g.24470  ORF Transcript_11294/g.24470 Transcript_11294/m.24470 type:complete len:83 (+) Transcript_11294:136-384(+)